MPLLQEPPIQEKTMNTPDETVPTVSIKLTPYAWGRLLSALEDQMQICNRNQSNTIELWEMIASQLNGRDMHVLHSQNPDPKYRPLKEPAKEAPVEQTPEKKKKWFFQ